MGKKIIAQRRGRGSPTFRSPSHRHAGAVSLPSLREGSGLVTKILHAPGRSAPLARVRFKEGEFLLLAPEGLAEGQEVLVGAGEIERGHIVEIGGLPEGTLVCNIELKPGDGGKLCRAAGTAAAVVSRGTQTVIQLPSGEFKDLDPACRAQVGVVAGSGQREKPFAKAGKKVNAFRSTAKAAFKVRGVAMNAVAHPHGGGSHQHVGRPSTVSRNAPPGRKVGRLSPQKRKKKARGRRV
ncbi:MAG: 50S ribosomal protein L2 [Candidatus Thermoplasmatota archaeon]|nr:50S ribosomal protein L2 [Candidatus Thermoplasmatota archaeon]